MLLLVGLGNPGKKYQNNRHNVGYMMIDYIAKLLNCYIVKEIPKLSNTTIQQCNNDVFLAKPLTFMNNSGKTIKNLIRNWKLEIGNLVVIHDDLDIPLGKFKIQKGVGPKLHNGIESIEKALGVKDFWRVRIGVDNRMPKQWIDGETYVLQNFTSQEKNFVQEIFPKIWDRVQKELIFGAL